MTSKVAGVRFGFRGMISAHRSIKSLYRCNIVHSSFDRLVFCCCLLLRCNCYLAGTPDDTYFRVFRLKSFIELTYLVALTFSLLKEVHTCDIIPHAPILELYVLHFFKTTNTPLTAWLNFWARKIFV